MDYHDYIRTVPLKERNNMTDVLTEISLQRIQETPKEYKRVQKVIGDLIEIFQDQYNLHHYESIAMVKILQDMLLADCYEQVMKALDLSNDEESFTSLFLSCER